MNYYEKLGHGMVTVLVEKKTKDTILDKFESIILLNYENIIIYKASKYPNLLKAFNTNFNKLWETERINGTYQNLLNKIQGATKWISVVFKPMSLTWDQVDKLKKAIRKKCPDVNSTKVRANPHKNKTCYL